MREIVTVLERLNLTNPGHPLGANFNNILGLLSIVFGGSFLLFGWNHRRYYMGVIGFLAGGWGGLVLRDYFSLTGIVTSFLFIALAAAAGALIAAYWERAIGIMLGGFAVAFLASTLLPSAFQSSGQHGYLALSFAFLLGGGLGGLFPKFFFVLNASIIGASFVTYGISTVILSRITLNLWPAVSSLIPVALYTALLIFGMTYQMFRSDGKRPARLPDAKRQPVHA